MAVLTDYQAAVASQYGMLIAALNDGTSDAYAIALRRVAHEGMDQELKKSPQEVINKWEFAAAKEKVPGPTLWQMDWGKRADKELHPFVPTEADILNKDAEYRTAFAQQLSTLNVKTHTTGSCDVNYFIEENPFVQNVKDAFRQALQDWMMMQRYEPTFYQRSAIVGMATVLEQRQDIVIALRAAQDMGAGGVTPFPIDVPIWQEALAIGISFVPFLGNAIALAEAYEGRDLFCRKLSMAERVLTVVLIAMPALLKVAKAGKAIYTAERMAKLYGRDAAKWSRMIQMGERATAHPIVRRAVLQAAERVKAKHALDAQLVKDAEQALVILTGKAAGQGSTAAVSDAQRQLLEALKKLGASKPALAELDQLALNRVVDAARTKNRLDVNLAKGQLLEELKESRTVKLLRQQFGKRALGLEGIGILEYFPGHVLTDAKNAKITDGIVGTRLPKSQIKAQWWTVA